MVVLIGFGGKGIYTTYKKGIYGMGFGGKVIYIYILWMDKIHFAPGAS